MNNCVAVTMISNSSHVTVGMLYVGQWQQLGATLFLAK